MKFWRNIATSQHYFLFLKPCDDPPAAETIDGSQSIMRPMEMNKYDRRSRTLKKDIGGKKKLLTQCPIGVGETCGHGDRAGTHPTNALCCY